jgi:hypothetical protein
LTVRTYIGRRDPSPLMVREDRVDKMSTDVAELVLASA